jgi:O-antigen/teichoic acid export membrane protein
MEKSDSEALGGKPPASIGATATRGAVWIYGRMMVVQLIHLAAIAVLARQLDIQDFGIVALANVALMFVGVLAGQGVNQFIIYDREEGFEERAGAAFWLSILFGATAVIVGYLVAPFLARFYEEPQLAPVLLVLLLRFPIEAVTRVFDAVLNKQLRFKSIEIRDTVVELGVAVGSIGMALSGFGVWSLVIPAVVLAPVLTLVAIWTTPWRPGWNLRIGQWPRIMRYTSSIIGSSFTSFIITHGDALLIGRIMGSGLLGIYNLAWQTGNLVSKNIVNIGSKLFFPVLSAVADDRERLVHVLRRLMRILSGITFPALIGLFVVADDFIHVIYGSKWEAAVLPLRILIVYAIRFSVGSPLGPVLKAIGRPDLIFKLGLVTVPCYCGAIVFGSDHGIVGVATGVTVVRTVFGGLTFVIVARQLKVSTWQLIAPMISSLAAATLMGLAVYGSKVGWATADAEYGVVKLVGLVLIGMMVYLLAIRHLFRDVSREFADFTQPLLGKWSALFKRLLNVGA